MALERIDTVDVIDVDDARCQKSAKELGEKVDWKPAPWQLPKDAVRECESWTKMNVSI